MLTRALCAMMLVLFLGSTEAMATTIRVPSQQPNIQAGVDVASAGDTVLIAPGTYSGTGNWDITISTPGILVGSEAGAGSTIIDLQGQGPAITTSDAGDTTTVIFGLTFTGGVGTSGYPACIYMMRSATVRDCVFEGNEGHTGGAVKLWSGWDYVFERCVFSDNHVSDWGGAISNHYSLLIARDCIFWNNSADVDGGAIWLQGAGCHMYGCTFVGNSGTPSGAIGCGDMSAPNTVIRRSIIAFSGEGLAIGDECQEADVSHCCVYGNGGGDSLPTGSHDNIFVDPRLCGIETGDVGLCADSPCLASSPDNPWSALLGALGQGCDACGSTVSGVSWGRLKAAFGARE
jgi:hypothetical protein